MGTSTHSRSLYRKKEKMMLRPQHHIFIAFLYILSVNSEIWGGTEAIGTYRDENTINSYTNSYQQNINTNHNPQFDWSFTNRAQDKSYNDYGKIDYGNVYDGYTGDRSLYNDASSEDDDDEYDEYSEMNFDEEDYYSENDHLDNMQNDVQSQDSESMDREARRE